MSESPHNDATLLLEPARRGDSAAAACLLPMVYGELRGLAARFLGGERHGHTLQPTALVHEAYLKLVDRSRVDWQGRTHFVAVAAEAMRRILVDHARARLAQKRGGNRHRMTMLPDIPEAGEPEVDVLAVDAALQKLASLNQRHARIVELRYFGGLTVEEVAMALGVSRATIEASWTGAKAWLRRELSKDGRP